jgi:hypothetical protein
LLAFRLTRPASADRSGGAAGGPHLLEPDDGSPTGAKVWVFHIPQRLTLWQRSVGKMVGLLRL